MKLLRVIILFLTLAGCNSKAEEQEPAQKPTPAVSSSDSQACENLQKTACENNQMKIAQLKERRAEYEREFNILFDSITKKKLNEKIASLASINSLLKDNKDNAIDSHVKFLNENGKEIMKKFFIRNYSSTGSGLDSFVNYTFSSRMKRHLNSEESHHLQETIKNKKINLSDIGNDINGERTRFFNFLFNELSMEDLTYFIKAYISIQYELFFQKTEREIFSDPHFRKQIIEKFFPDDKRKKVEAIFMTVKQDAENLLMSNLKEKKSSPMLITVKEKLQKITIGSFSPYLSPVNIHTTSYSTAENKIDISAPDLDISYWSLYWTLSHELAHAFDPLNNPSFSPLWEKITDCLQKEFSMTQMGEVFADLFAIELLMKTLSTNTLLLDDQKREAIFDAIRLCDSSKFENTQYPSDPKRVNLTFRAHPLFNNIFKCSNSPMYCGSLF